MLLKLSTPIPSSRLSLTKKLKTNIIHIRGSSQTPTLRKKFSPHLNKSFNCYEEPSVLPSYNRQSPSILRDSLAAKKTKNRIRIIPKSSTANLFSQAKQEMASKNYVKALDLLNKVLQDDHTIDILYFHGVCLMHLKLYSEAIGDLKKVQESSPNYDPQLYVALYMCYLYTGEISNSLKVLTMCIRLFPNFSKAFLLRGQILNKLKKYDQALRDLRKFEDPESHLYMAESWKGKNNIEKALKHLEIALKSPSLLNSALLEKVKILYKLKKFEEAASGLTFLLESSETNFSALYYMAKIHLVNNELIQASLLLEQVIQNANDAVISSRALCKLSLIRIKEKDFYGALHTLHRTNGKLQSKKKKSIFQYTEAVISLMKRKFSDGITLLTGLIDENVLKEYIHNCFLYRAYGYYAKGDYVLSIKDYKSASLINKLDKASEFNFSISQAIVKCAEDKYKEAWKILKSVRGVFPKNPMPEICQICVLLTDSVEDTKILKKALKILENAVKRRTDSEILFIKALIQYFQGDFEKSYVSIKECIDKAEENVACHYAMRGFCNVALRVYSEAVQDFTIALQLNEMILSIYPFRGLCAYLSEDYNLALDDFIFYSNDHQNSSIILSAKLLMFTACYTEALQVLSKASDTEEILVLRAYCFLMNFEYHKSIDLLGRLKNIDVSEDILHIKELSIGKIYKDSGIGYIFTKKYALWLKGIGLLYDEHYEKAIEVFQDVLEIMHSSEGDIFNDNIIIEEENCEVLFNIALCNTLNFIDRNGPDSNREHSLLILKELAEVVNTEHRGQLYLISAVIELFHKNKESAEVMLQESAKCSPEACRKFIESEIVTVLPLHTGNEFSAKFPLITCKSFPKVSVRPAITLPKFLPALEMADTFDILKSFFTFETITPRPEAPWLNRSKGSIQFTDSILDLDIEDSKKNSKRLPVAAKICKSQEIRKKQNSFVKGGDEKKTFAADGLFDKIKEICS